MSSNPYQRKDHALEQLANLRNKVRQTFFANRCEVLQTPKNKNSPYYTSLKDDIFEKTNTSISEGTLLKFFHDDINRKYQLIVIRTIEDYVKPITTDDSNEKDWPVSGSFNIKLQDKAGEEIKMFAQRLYIELTTRKAAIPIDEENDVIEEIYNSWYKLFCVIREEIKNFSVYCFVKQNDPVEIIDLSRKILNEVLRPHLTFHQAKFRRWLESAKQNAKYKSITPQELQKKYPDYQALKNSMKNVNEELILFSEKTYKSFMD